MKDKYHIHPMTIEYAREIAVWTYQGPYAVYSFQPDKETLAELTGGDYYASVEECGKLAGYFCFGAAAQIPTVEANAYPDGFLDIGLVMDPKLCGQGRGTAFLEAGIDYARNRFHPAALRLTVAAFNKRAISVYEKQGFIFSSVLTHANSRSPFYLMIQPVNTTKPLP